jgi:TolA-binding protein
VQKDIFTWRYVMKIKAMARAVSLGVATLALPATVLATPTVEELAQQLDQMQQEIKQLRAQLKDTATKDEIVVTQQLVEAVKVESAKSGEWRQPDTLVHLAGYADVGYVNGDNQDGSFTVGTFAPIPH